MKHFYKPLLLLLTTAVLLLGWLRRAANCLRTGKKYHS